MRLGIAAVLLFAATAAGARVLMTQEQALTAAFPGQTVARQKFFLTPEQREAAARESGVAISDSMIVRYAAPNGSVAYFDTHRVRTLPETVMIVVDNAGAVERVDILSFDEPTDYFPKQRWLDQFRRRKLDRELALKGAIRPISGASLTGTAIVNATRKVLALHHALSGVAPR